MASDGTQVQHCQKHRFNVYKGYENDEYRYDFQLFCANEVTLDENEKLSGMPYGSKETQDRKTCKEDVVCTGVWKDKENKPKFGHTHKKCCDKKTCADGKFLQNRNWILKDNPKTA